MKRRNAIMAALVSCLRLVGQEINKPPATKPKEDYKLGSGFQFSTAPSTSGEIAKFSINPVYVSLWVPNGTDKLIEIHYKDEVISITAAEVMAALRNP